MPTHQLFDVRTDDRHRGLQLARRAELDNLGAIGEHREVTGAQVVRVAGADDLEVIGVVDAELTANDVAPVRALAAVIGQALEVRGRIGTDRERLERHRPVIELDVAALDHGQVDLDRGLVLTSAWHGFLLR